MDISEFPVCRVPAPMYSISQQYHPSHDISHRRISNTSNNCMLVTRNMHCSHRYETLNLPWERKINLCSTAHVLALVSLLTSLVTFAPLLSQTYRFSWFEFCETCSFRGCCSKVPPVTTICRSQSQIDRHSLVGLHLGVK
jgi:hypothetical protein